jgi:hypothetical protein
MPGEPVETGGLLLGLRDLVDDMKERSIFLAESRRQRGNAKIQIKDVIRAVQNRVQGRRFSISAGSYDRRPSANDYEVIPIEQMPERSDSRLNNGAIV